jgi:hypothetical protein
VAVLSAHLTDNRFDLDELGGRVRRLDEPAETGEVSD